MTVSPDLLRRELLPSTQLEELFFDTIVRLSTCAHFLGAHVEAGPEFSNPETPRRLRLLLITESKLRVAYEEFRRLKLARQLQVEDGGQAARPLLAVVATHTSRSGFRAQPRSRPAPHPVDRQLQRFQLSDAAADARFAAECTAHLETAAAAAHAVASPKAPGRNAPCPCNSGRKYKHCCLNRTPAVREGISASQAA